VEYVVGLEIFGEVSKAALDTMGSIISRYKELDSFFVSGIDEDFTLFFSRSGPRNFVRVSFRLMNVNPMISKRLLVIVLVADWKGWVPGRRKQMRLIARWEDYYGCWMSIMIAWVEANNLRSHRVV